MKEFQTIIRRPLVTEKSTQQRDSSRQYVFEVHPDANKIEVRHAVEHLFKVKVEDVRTLNVLGKMKRLGRKYGKRPDWKKATVTLKEGFRIDFFEGT